MNGSVGVHRLWHILFVVFFGRWPPLHATVFFLTIFLWFLLARAPVSIIVREPPIRARQNKLFKRVRNKFVIFLFSQKNRASEK